jgi:hypothetical protein
MHLSEEELKQLDEAYLDSLPVEKLQELSVKMLADLKAVRARLEQQRESRSRAASSRSPGSK